MTFAAWREWMGSLPWVLRWFPLLVLLRPVIDNLYFLKEVSPLLSPPYIIGVITPLACIAACIRYRQPTNSTPHKTFMAWAVMLVAASLFVLLHDPLSMLSVEFALKLSMPVYLFFFLRVLIRDRRDLHGILQTFLYSAIGVAALLMYELLINPISLEESRGLMRIQGSFGDVVSYGMYIIFSTLIATYYFFARQEEVKRSSLIVLIAAVGTLSLLGLVNIHHTATYGTFMVLFVLFFIFNLNNRSERLALALLVAVGIGFSMFGSELIDEKITPLLETDLAVYQGDTDSDRLLHGRVGRWRRMIENFSAEPVHIQFFGLPVKFEPAFAYIGIGSHNDFFRILFATGFIGLLLYLRFLTLIFTTGRRLPTAQRYLVYGTLIALLFFSISVTPTFYAPFLYFALSVFVYALLPQKTQAA